MTMKPLKLNFDYVTIVNLYRKDLFMKKISSILAGVACMALLLTGCSSDNAANDEKETATPKTNIKAEQSSDVNDLGMLTENTIDAVIRLTNGEEIDIELYPDVAPKTVANFVKNVQEGFYSGTIFHRAIEGFVVQGGGYDTNYELKSVSETVEGEFEDNGIENDLSHIRGVLSMARTSQPNSATTQFFIVQEDSTYLDGQYAAFGAVNEGMDVVDEIASAPQMKEPPTGLENVPEEQFVIESITILSDAENSSDATDVNIQ